MVSSRGRRAGLEALLRRLFRRGDMVAGYALFSGRRAGLRRFLRRLFRGGDAEGCTFSGNRTTAEFLPLYPALRRRAERLPGFVTLLRTEGCLFRSGRKRAVPVSEEGDRAGRGASLRKRRRPAPVGRSSFSRCRSGPAPVFRGPSGRVPCFRRQRLFSFASMHSVA